MERQSVRYAEAMKTTTSITLPVRLAIRLVEEADSRGLTRSTVVATALRQYFTAKGSADGLEGEDMPEGTAEMGEEVPY